MTSSPNRTSLVEIGIIPTRLLVLINKLLKTLLNTIKTINTKLDFVQTEPFKLNNKQLQTSAGTKMDEIYAYLVPI